MSDETLEDSYDAIALPADYEIPLHMLEAGNNVNDVLAWNGTTWVSTVSGAALTEVPLSMLEDGKTANDVITWNGTTWVGGAPAANKSLIIAANYTSPGSNFDLQGCSLTVQNNAVVTIVPQDSVILSGGLTVTTGSTMTFEAKAHLIQSGTTNLNSGNVVVKANSSPIKRLDYTLWSAPVAGQLLLLS